MMILFIFIAKIKVYMILFNRKYSYLYELTYFGDYYDWC